LEGKGMRENGCNMPLKGHLANKKKIENKS